MGRSSIKSMMEGFDSPVGEVSNNPYLRTLSTKLSNSSNLDVYRVPVNESKKLKKKKKKRPQLGSCIFQSLDTSPPPPPTPNSMYIPTGMVAQCILSF